MKITHCTIFTKNIPSLAFYRVNAMSTNPNKQIVYRLEEEDHKNLRIKAAEEGLTPNQYAKKHILNLIKKDEKNTKES